MTIYRCLASGTFPDAEDWSFSQFCNSTLSTSDAATAWNNAVSAYWTAAKSHHAPGVDLSGTVVYGIDPATGHATSRAATANVQAGTGATETLPAEVSLAVSKLTTEVGPDGRGRFYLPPLVVADMSGGRFSAAAQTAIEAAVKALMDSLVGATMTPILWGIGSKIIYNLTGFRIGNVPDSQRRRRRKSAEVYVQSAL